MNYRKLTAAILAAASLCCSTAAFAEETEVIAPQTYITDSTIGDLNVYNNIISKHFGNGVSVGQSEIIAPTVVMSGVDASLVNVINNIVCIDVSIDVGDLVNRIYQYGSAYAARQVID